MNKEFLYTLLDNMSVSGHEIELQKKVIEEMTPWCDEIRTDCTGNVICVLNPDAPYKVLLAGHVDEIGLVVTHIQSDGLLRVGRVGGIYTGDYPGHQVVIHSACGKIYGAVNNHDGVHKENMKPKELYIDIGAKDGADAKKYVEVGDPVHFHSYHQEMLNNHLSARGIDDRGGVFIIMEALKRARERGCKIGVYAASTVGEETTGRGANWAACGIRADAAIAVDVTYANDVPGYDAAASGDVHLGEGPVICNSSLCNKKLNDLLKTCGKEKGIPYQVETFIGRTSTDGDTIHLAGTCTTTALVSLPLRYMHNPGEMCSLTDVENSIELIAEFLCRVNENTDFNPFH